MFSEVLMVVPAIYKKHLYKMLGNLAPAFWGRQVEHHVPELIAASDFRIVSEQVVRQAFYPSRVLVART